MILLLDAKALPPLTTQNAVLPKLRMTPLICIGSYQVVPSLFKAQNTPILLPQMPELPLNLKGSLVIPSLCVVFLRPSSSRNLADFHYNKLLLVQSLLLPLALFRATIDRSFHNDYKSIVGAPALLQWMYRLRLMAWRCSSRWTSNAI